MASCGHNNRIELDDIVITALAVIAAIVAIGATATMLIRHSCFRLQIPTNERAFCPARVLPPNGRRIHRGVVRRRIVDPRRYDNAWRHDYPTEAATARAEEWMTKPWVEETWMEETGVDEPRMNEARVAKSGPETWVAKPTAHAAPATCARVASQQCQRKRCSNKQFHRDLPQLEAVQG
jgi:hypothetical protein